MDWPALILALLIGFALGIGISFLLRIIHTHTSRNLADRMFEENREAFSRATFDALKNVVPFLETQLKSATEAGAKEIESKRQLIDQQLQGMRPELQRIVSLVQALEKDRAEKFGQLSSEIRTTSELTATLSRETQGLREALSSSAARGQWGERMAEDVLRLAGFIEGVNYLKQKTIEASGTRPDFTFLLPKDLKLHMDVKFPLDNYTEYLNAETESEKERRRTDFFRDVRARVKEVTSREYINPSDNTADYALLFIPNEQVYAFIQEEERSIIDEALKKKIVLCSPLNLFAILSVIREAVDAFALEKTSGEILQLLGDFNKQWSAFVEKMDALGKRIEAVQKEYDSLSGTRRRMLERPLNRIEELRGREKLPAATEDETETIVIAEAERSDEDE